jgi:hypothetical protein
MVKKLFIKIVLFLLLLILVDFISGYFFTYLQKIALKNSPYAMVTEYTMQKVQTDVILIGASETTHGYIPNIIQDSLNMSVYNCGKDGYRFYYQASMVHGIIQRYRPKLIVWSVYPDFLSHPSSNDFERLSILKPFANEDDFVRSVLLKKDFFEKYKLESNLYRFNSRLFPLLYKAISKDYKFEYGGFVPLENENNKYPSRQYTTVKNDFDTVLGFSLGTILEKCNKVGTKVVFVLPPRLEIHDFSRTRQFIEFRRIANIYNAKIIDQYYNSYEFISDSTYFKDIGHLNRRGAVKFSTLISKELMTLIND